MIFRKETHGISSKLCYDRDHVSDSVFYVSVYRRDEEPVKSIEGYVTRSIDKLAKEFIKVEKFVDKPLMTFYVTLHESDSLKQIGEEKDSVSKLLEDFSEMIAQYI